MSEFSVRSHLEQASRCHQVGQFAEAQRLYREILAHQPDTPGALHYLGLLTHQLGQSQAGIEMLRRSVQLAPQAAPFRHNLAMVLQETGQPEAAAAEFSAVTRLQPDHAEAFARLADCLGAIGRPDEALRALQRAIELRPESAETHNSLGAILRQTGRNEEAARSFQTAVSLAPRDAVIHANLGAALCTLHRLNSALEVCRRAMELGPTHSIVWLNLATVLWKQRQLDQAIEVARKAIELDPHDADAHIVLGGALNDQGLVDAAVGEFRRAIELQPELPGHSSTYVYTLHFSPAADPREILREHEIWDQRFARPLLPAWPAHSNNPDPARRLRLGYVGPTFRLHVVGLYLEPLLESHDHSAFEIVCYSDVTRPDEGTARLRSHADLWRDTSTLTDAQLADQIRRDEIDILVDLNLHMAGSRLLAFARRPAPVQVCHLGYPATTGLKAMDYAFTDVHLDPPGEADGFYTERLLRLPDTYWCYKPPEGCPPVNELPALNADGVTFGSLNNFCKINDAVLAVWGRILAAVPRSRLAVMLDGGPSANPSVMRRMSQHGIPQDRLLFLPRSSRAEYMRLYHQIDIALDPFPYAGHTTSFDAVWMGVPLVTLPGPTSVSRAGVTVLSNLGLTNLVARSTEQYIDLARNLAGNLPELAAVRASLRERVRSSPLTDAIRYTRNCEAALRGAWSQWCSSEGTLRCFA